MWQHTIDVLRTTNCLSKASVVWSANEGYYNNGDAWNNPTPYPGDSYVDWVARTATTTTCRRPGVGLFTPAGAVRGIRSRTATTRRRTRLAGVEHDFRGSKPFWSARRAGRGSRTLPGRKGQWMIDMGTTRRRTCRASTDRLLRHGVRALEPRYVDLVDGWLQVVRERSLFRHAEQLSSGGQAYLKGRERRDSVRGHFVVRSLRTLES